MATIDNLLDHGSLLPIVLLFAVACVLIEFLVLSFFWWKWHKGITPGQLGANAGSGGCLLLVAWLATTQGSKMLILCALLASLICHICDQLKLRMRSLLAVDSVGSQQQFGWGLAAIA